MIKKNKKDFKTFRREKGGKRAIKIIFSKLPSAWKAIKICNCYNLFEMYVCSKT